MAGHNKWSKIKRQKEKTDAQKSKIFGKLAKLIADESRKAKGIVTSPGLRAAIEKAKEFNMPADNIDRAVKKGSGLGAGTMEAVTYEAYGPGGSALVIDALTENRNKAAQEIKFILSKHGIQLAAPGSATWAFDKVPGQGWIPKEGMPLVKLPPDEESKLEALIDELEENDEVQEVFTNAE